MNKTKILVGLFVLSLWLIFCIGWVIVQYILYPNTASADQSSVDVGLIFAHTVRIGHLTFVQIKYIESI